MADLACLFDDDEPHINWRTMQKIAAAAEPDRSVILCEVKELLPGWGGQQGSIAFGEFASEGKAAFWENEGSTLGDCAESILQGFDDLYEGWWVIDGFTAHYSVSWEGEHDADYEAEDIRRARWSDLKHFGYPVPWWVGLLLLIRVDLHAPPL
jgi:hypothetical protein